jgi:hypothetical protein
MRIRNVRLDDLGPRVRLVADCKIRKIGWDLVYFEFDKKYQKFIYVDASPFVSALIIPSMRYKEDLIVEGALSKKLFQNMHSLIQKVTSSGWERMNLHKINLKADNIEEDRGTPKRVATSFSAGVDSFYTFLKHIKGPNKITHLIIIDGYDIDLRNKALWKSTLRNVYQVAKEANVEVIEARTNIKELLEPMIEWEDFCGGGLSAVPMAIRNGIKVSFLPSGFAEEQQFPSGSNLMIDHLWSTERFNFVHDGAEARRVDKVITTVGKSPLALKHLRICHDNKRGRYNCGKCDKCLRTMISLTITETLSLANTLPNKLDLKKLSELNIPSSYAAIFHQENLEELKKRNLEPETQLVLTKILETFRHRTETQYHTSLIDRVIYLDHLYIKGSLRKLVRPVVGNKF